MVYYKCILDGFFKFIFEYTTILDIFEYIPKIIYT